MNIATANWKPLVNYYGEYYQEILIKGGTILTLVVNIPRYEMPPRLSNICDNLFGTSWLENKRKVRKPRRKLTKRDLIERHPWDPYLHIQTER